MGISQVSGDGISWLPAHVDCERCEPLGGWSGIDSGLHCPFGCGVRVFSTNDQENERYRAESAVREQIRRDRRALRRLQPPVVTEYDCLNQEGDTDA